MPHSLFLVLLIFAAALVYSSVGHAGASGYVAAMELMGVSPEVMKPAALVLNVVVGAIATARFYRAGYFSWPLLWPFLVGSMPLAFVGGAIHLPPGVYKPVVGVLLLVAAARVTAADRSTRAAQLSRPAAVAAGAVIGLLSGLTGIGGSIFLSPLLIVLGWADPRQTAGVSAAFVLLNSISGLAGNLASVPHLPAEIGYWALAAAAGGVIGSEIGSRHLPPNILRYLLAAILAIAGLKMLLQ